MDSWQETTLKSVFEAVFENASDVTKLRQLSEATWDSLANTTLIAALESEFGVLFDIDDMERMTSYQAVKALLEEKGI